MRISLRFYLPFITVLLFLVTALFLLLGSTYFFYTNAIDQLVSDKGEFLKFVRESIYSPMFYYRTFSQFPSLKYAVYEEAAKNSGVNFFRVVEPGTNKIIWTSVANEKIGTIADRAPYFSPEINLRDGTWQGQPVKEIFISGVASEGLWIGVSLKSVKESALNIAIKQGMIVLAILLVIYSIFYFILRKMILIPLEKVHSAISQVQQGNFDAKIDTGTKTEIGDLASIFNDMTRDLKKSHSALEEAKSVLEIRVNARTRELKELTESLDEQIKNKTKELRERVEELEKFQKLAVGRELKMVALKEEIERMKTEPAGK